MSKKVRIIITGGAFCLILAAIFIIPLINKAPAPLSADELAALREDYPIYSGENPSVYMRHLALDEYMEDCDTFVYAEVLDGPFYSEEEISTGIPEFDEKGGLLHVSYFTYRVSVLEDSRHALKKGDIIEIKQNILFEQNYPKLEQGTRISLGISRLERTESERSKLVYDYSTDGMFYVTDDGYAISVFSEENQKVRSGLHIKNLLREFS